MHSDIIAKEIECSIKKTPIKKPRLNHGVYECTYNGGIISNYWTTIIYLILKSINQATRIGASNIKYEVLESKPSLVCK